MSRASNATHTTCGSTVEAAPLDAGYADVTPTQVACKHLQAFAGWCALHQICPDAGAMPSDAKALALATMHATL